MTQLELQHIGVSYAGQPALTDISATLTPGVTGLIGANGAGKSTLIRVLVTLQSPTTGKLIWNGQDVTRKPKTLRQVLGYVPQYSGLYDHLSPVEFLRYMAAAKGLSVRTGQLDALLEQVNLSAHADQPIGSFSGGMRQRVLIAQSLLGQPQLLVLDEPTVGLDAAERQRLSALIRDLAADRIIVICTHIASDLEDTADRLWILAGGRLVDQQDAANLRTQGQSLSAVVDHLTARGVYVR